jgi:streptomycin 6-kinase
LGTVPGEFASTIASVFQEDGLRWLERLPALVAACERRWSIAAQAPFEPLSYNYIAPAIRADGTEVILKLGVPNPELTTEIEALSLYGGRGSVRLLDVDRHQGALLLERLQPGTPLLAMADDERATRVAARVMRRLWRAVPPEHPFPTVTRWAAGLDRLRARFHGSTGPLPQVLVEQAEGLFVDLLGSMAEPVLLHGDLHHENILSAQREPWLAIDPKGVVGEPAYEVGALLRNVAPRRPGSVIARRADLLAEELGFDRRRLLGWGLAQAVLAAWWCIEDQMQGWEGFVRCAEIMDQVRRERPSTRPLD